MYRVIVMDRGKDNNVTLGARYCFTKRSVISLASYFMLMECECRVEKFVHLHSDIFCWSDAGLVLRFGTKFMMLLKN